jgi:hypothetical protein
MFTALLRRRCRTIPPRSSAGEFNEGLSLRQKLDAAGRRGSWTRQFGTAKRDIASAIARELDGDLTLAGLFPDPAEPISKMAIGTA